MRTYGCAKNSCNGKQLGTHEELLYITANVQGIKFYDGYDELMSSNGFLHVRLVEESNNPHDSNAILVVSYYSGKIVGHLERAVAGSISQLIKIAKDGIVLKRLIIHLHAFIVASLLYICCF